MALWVKGILVAVLVFILDQWSKWAIFSLLQEKGHPIEIIPFFNLVMVYNPGISFGLFGSLAVGKIIFSVLALAITLFLLRWLYVAKTLFLSTGLGLIIGGATGNVTDRIRLGAVADFMDFYIGDWHWPAFNVADSAVFIGVVIILFDSFIDGSKEKNHAEKK